MQGKIGLEEHFAIAQTLADSGVFLPDRCWPELSRRLVDLRQERIAAMDAHGMEMMILSLNAPTVQGMPDPGRANEVARLANDALAEEVARRPDRFAALAALPMQDVELATRELERCVKQLGFCGALVNGFAGRRSAGGVLLRHAGLLAILGRSERLGVRSICIRAIRCRPGRRFMRGILALGSHLGFGVEATTHALRLMGSGLSDRRPGLDIILGHLGRPALQHLARRQQQRLGQGAHRCLAKKPIGDYFRANFISPPPAISAARP